MKKGFSLQNILRGGHVSASEKKIYTTAMGVAMAEQEEEPKASYIPREWENAFPSFLFATWK